MAIKYNGLDLSKRIIDGREVEKVMYNGTQIRPTAPSPIPSTYKQVEYINNAWGWDTNTRAFIDTGLIINTPYFKMEFGMTPYVVYTNNQYFYARGWKWLSYEIWFDIRTLNVWMSIWIRVWWTYDVYGVNEVTYWWDTVNDIWTVKFIRDNQICADTTYSGTIQQDYNTLSFWWAHMDMYYWKIYKWTSNDNLTLVRDYVPVVRRSDNMVWMYDKVEWVFYTSPNGYLFTAWPDV